MAAAAAGTIGGLYLVITQDLGHGPGHDEDHHAEAHETHGKNKGQDDAFDDNDDDSSDDKSSSDDESKDAAEGMAQGGPKDAAKSKSKNAPKEEQNNEEADDPSKPGSGKPDKKKAADASTDDKKADESDKASPDKSDKVGRLEPHEALHTDYYSPMLAVSLRAPTKRLASKKVSPTAIHITARKSPSKTERARRARVLLRRQSSRARFPPKDLEPRTRRREARPRLTRTRKAVCLAAPSKHPVFHSALAATIHRCTLYSVRIQSIYARFTPFSRSS
jgi:hypothetical protein